jgi:hypothetical protein
MIDELITALENLQEAIAELREASKNCESDRGYFLHREYKAVDDAKEDLSRIFKSAVASVVVEVINNKSYLPE